MAEAMSRGSWKGGGIPGWHSGDETTVVLTAVPKTLPKFCWHFWMRNILVAMTTFTHGHGQAREYRPSINFRDDKAVECQQHFAGALGLAFQWRLLQGSMVLSPGIWGEHPETARSEWLGEFQHAWGLQAHGLWWIWNPPAHHGHLSALGLSGLSWMEELRNAGKKLTSPASPVQVIVRVMVQVIATGCGKTSGCLVAVATSAVTGLTNGDTALGPATGLVDLGKSDGLTAGARRTMTMTGWWFQTFFIFNNIWDNPSHWLIFFRGVETTNQMRTMRTMIASGTVTNMIRNGKDPSAGLVGMDRMASMRVRDKLWSNKKNRPHMEMQPGLGKAMPIMHLLRDFGAFRDLQDFRQCLKILRRRKQTSNLGVFRQWKVLGIQSRKTQEISIPSFLNFFKMIRIQKLQANSQPLKLTKFVNRKLWLHWWWWRDMPAPAAILALPSGPHVKITFSARQSVTRKWWMTLQMLQTFRPSAREGPRNCHRVAWMLLMSMPPDVCSKATVGSTNRYAQKSEEKNNCVVFQLNWVFSPLP